MKLNLGCGDRKIHGFINIDARGECNPDIIADIRNTQKIYKDVELIYACHVLEHFPMKPSTFQDTTYLQILKNWYDTLKSGGILRLSVPDFEVACSRYLSTGNLSEIKHLINGGQKYDFDFHYCCWDFATLKKTLHDVGFKDIRRYDWKKTEHFFVDDYSQSFLPHMDKTNGQLMSLNIEATK
jgi:predicted SAM-dependent methyltransferase